MDEFLHQKLTYLQGVGPVKAAMLESELHISNFAELLTYFPFRYEDRSIFTPIYQLNEERASLIKGKLGAVKIEGEGHTKRIVTSLHDETGLIELVFFKGIDWLLKKLAPGQHYIAYGKPQLFRSSLNLPHPEIELTNGQYSPPKTLTPIYNLTEKLRKRQIDNKFIINIIQAVFKLYYATIEENLSEELITDNHLISRKLSLLRIHFPANELQLEQARYRIKFEELFFLQLRLLKLNKSQKTTNLGYKCPSMTLVTDFYKNHLPFELTNAQKRVLKEIHADLQSGSQMNRLLQGDVGSGKTIVGFITILMAISNGYQACLMAPTEILTEQHYVGLSVLAQAIGIKIAKLTGSVKTKQRREILAQLADGTLQLVVGTHALITEKVVFQNLGLCIVDEQHRFGVAQRAALWDKSKLAPPHILLMTATPIPRTLAMTLYGELDVSIIDELPPGRKPIVTIHRRESSRLRVFGMMKEEISKGRQIYVVYPLIELSETLDFQNLMEGYENIATEFPLPEYQISIVHGRMKQEEREQEMQRFVNGITQIMVATTVIEVGVNVPNASVMIIESAERFGLSQLHQLRGRVGRGAEQSYCVLMSGDKLTKESRVRLQTMTETNDGFVIAEVDLRLRGPGDLAGTQQSGVLDLNLTNLATDGAIVTLARSAAIKIIEVDAQLELIENEPLLRYLQASTPRYTSEWSKIS